MQLLITMKKENVNYYEISSYPYGAGYGGTSHVRLKDENESILNNDTMIEILWPNAETSRHTISTTVKHDSSYDSDACQTFHTATVWAHIDIKCNGTILENVKITGIKNIKARIV